MKVLGISCYYHDASCALWIDGQLVAYALEERFSRIKHDSSFPKFAIEFCLKEANLSKVDIDHAVFYEGPSIKFVRLMKSSLKNFPLSFKSFKNFCESWLAKKFWILTKIGHHLNIPSERIHTSSHHISHAYSSFLMSGFEHSAVLVVDGAGENTSISIHSFRRVNNIIEHKEILELDHTHSLGLFYAAFTAFLGFKVNSGECSLMALAAFGKPIYKDKINELFDFTNQEAPQMKEKYLYFDFLGSLPFTKDFIDLFGPPKNFKHAHNTDHPSKSDEYFADIAASVQSVLEEQLLKLAQLTKMRTNSPHLCLSGGVALNCLAVAKIETSHIFERVYAPYDPGDGAASIGAAAQFINSLKELTSPISSPYQGPGTDNDELEAFTKDFNWKKLAHFNSYSKKKLKNVVVQTLNSSEEIINFAAKSLIDVKTVGWFQGRAEIGPRALGNRSILAVASETSLKIKLNDYIKKRPHFRPYAISLIEEDALKHLHYVKDETNSSMQSIVKVKDKSQVALASAIHVDGTTRPHIVGAKDNELLFELLVKMKELTGSSAILNTSFNESGEPIVNSPMDALQVFIRTDLDVLIVGNKIFLKEWDA